MRRATGWQAERAGVDMDGLFWGSLVLAGGHHSHGPCVRIVVRGWQGSRGPGNDGWGTSVLLIHGHFFL